jgi:hypothetical protein
MFDTSESGPLPRREDFETSRPSSHGLVALLIVLFVGGVFFYGLGMLLGHLVEICLAIFGVAG